LFIFRSLARWITNDTKIEEMDATIGPVAAVFNGDWFGIPVYLWILAGLVVVGVVFLHFSVFGRYFVAIGSNERAALFSGIPTALYKVLAYVLCSVLTSVYAFLALMKAPSVAPSTIGQNDELMAIAGAVLGGCTLRGGEGTIYGMVAGTMIIQILRMMNTFWGIPSAVEGTMIGVILLCGIILDEVLRRRDRSRGMV
jgi:ribose transport system permease protein